MSFHYIIPCSFFSKTFGETRESLNHVFGITGIMKIIGDRMKYVSTNFSQKTKLKFQIEIASSIDKIKFNSSGLLPI